MLLTPVSVAGAEAPIDRVVPVVVADAHGQGLGNSDDKGNNMGKGTSVPVSLNVTHPCLCRRR